MDAVNAEKANIIQRRRHESLLLAESSAAAARQQAAVEALYADSWAALQERVAAEKAARSAAVRARDDAGRDAGRFQRAAAATAADWSRGGRVTLASGV